MLSKSYRYTEKNTIKHSFGQQVALKLYQEKLETGTDRMNLNLATAIAKKIKKYFHKYINSKRMAKENPHPLLNVRETLTKEEERLKY